MKGGLFSALQNKSAQSALAAGACGLNAAKTDAPAARGALASGPRAPSGRAAVGPIGTVIPIGIGLPGGRGDISERHAVSFFDWTNGHMCPE